MTEQEIKKYLATKFFGKNIYCFDTIDSTNTYAKMLASEGAEEGTIVIAEEQTEGRGRFGRKWVSFPGKNLTFSVIIRPSIPPESIGILSLFAGLGVTEAVKEICPITPICKWPNDVLLNGKKLCGILSEAVFSNGELSAVIIGIGLNINQTEFPPAIVSTATSLAQASGHEFNRASVLASVLEKLEHLYTHTQNNNVKKILRQWQNHTTMFGNHITVDQHGNRLKGIARALDDDGGLIISVNEKEQKLFAGDVTIEHDEA